MSGNTYPRQVGQDSIRYPCTAASSETVVLKRLSQKQMEAALSRPRRGVERRQLDTASVVAVLVVGVAGPLAGVDAVS